MEIVNMLIRFHFVVCHRGRELSPAMEVYYNKLMCYGNIYDNPTMSFSSSSFHHNYVHVIVVIIIVIIVIVIIVII